MNEFIRESGSVLVNSAKCLASALKQLDKTNIYSFFQKLFQLFGSCICSHVHNAYSVSVILLSSNSAINKQFPSIDTGPRFRTFLRTSVKYCIKKMASFQSLDCLFSETESDSTPNFFHASVIKNRFYLLRWCSVS